MTSAPRCIHPIYHQLARVNQAWSTDKDQAYQRARATVNALVVLGFLTDGFWLDGDYCIDPADKANRNNSTGAPM
jgi:hypothetical protein